MNFRYSVQGKQCVVIFFSGPTTSMNTVKLKLLCYSLHLKCPRKLLCLYLSLLLTPAGGSDWGGCEPLVYNGLLAVRAQSTVVAVWPCFGCGWPFLAPPGCEETTLSSAYCCKRCYFGCRNFPYGNRLYSINCS